MDGLKRDGDLAVRAASPKTEMSIDKWVWCAHDTLVWAKAQVISAIHDEAAVGTEDDDANVEYLLALPDAPGTIRKVKADQVHRVDPTHELDLDNLCLLNDMHEAPLLDLLRRRFFSNRIYTFTGDVLISINPYQKIDGLYENLDRYLDKDSLLAAHGASVMDGLSTDGAQGSAPHVFRVANQALRALTEPAPGEQSHAHAYHNQSIIISGESGAGKTENSKYVLHFLIYANNLLGARYASKSSSSAGFEDHLKAVLVHSSVVLEAFGNAKTVRNDNSSRFGKYIKLLYLKEEAGEVANMGTFPHLVSANTETFLLEKSRLTSVGTGERTYHVFYQAFAGISDPSLRAELGLDQAEEQFELLTQGGYASHRVHDKEEFDATLCALKTLQFSDEEIHHIWRTIACIMHLNSITLLSNEEEASVAVKISCPTISWDRLAAFLGVEPVLMTIGLTTQELQVARRASIKIKLLSESEVRNNILALMKWLYSKLFDWIVRKINLCHGALSADRFPHLSCVTAGTGSAEDEVSRSPHFIGILDIFGFEILQTNSFEQLCINFTNERLQQQFNEHVFVSEQAMYAQEGLEWSNITFRDNQPVIDLISSSKKPLGLLLILEEQGMLNRKPDDIALLTAINQVHDMGQPVGKAAKEAAAKALYSKSRFGNDAFLLRHFAGEVTYNVDGFLAKNNDALQEDLMKLLKSTHSDFLVEMAQIERPDPTAPRVMGLAGGKKMASSASVSQQFRAQLDQLMSTLRSTSPHYIKCLKPNGEKVPNSFSANLVIQQLRYSGVLEVVRIRREGFPMRVAFADFYRNYKILVQGRAGLAVADADPASMSADELRDACLYMLQVSLQPEQFQLGHSMVFLRHDGLSEMKEAVKRYFGSRATVIQATYRARLQRHKYSHIKRMVRRLQGFIRMYNNRAKYLATRHAMLYIKRFLLAKRARRRFLIRYAQIIAERHIRTAMLLIKRFLVAKHTRKMFLIRYAQLLEEHRVRAATRMQAIARAYRARRAFRAMLLAYRQRQHQAATQLQSVVRMHQAVVRYVRLLNMANKVLACTLLQATMRRYIAARRFATVKHGIILLQSLHRMQHARRGFEIEFIRVIIAQSVVRRFLATRRYRHTRVQIVRIQSHIRRYKAQQQAFKLYASVICIQSFVRMMLVKTHQQALARRSVAIQAAVRKFVQRRRFLRARQAATLLQSHMRRLAARSRFVLQICASLAIQSIARMYIARRHYQEQLISAIILQSFLRRLYYRRQFLIAVCRAIIAQKLIRGHLALRRYRRTHRAIVKLQSFARMINATRSYSEVLISAIMIQARVRVYQARLAYCKAQMVVQVIQKLFRGAKAREGVGRQMRAIVMLQAFGRMINARRGFDECVVSAIMMQGLLRRFLARTRYLRACRACVTLQSFTRMALTRKDYRTEYRAVVVLQSFGRMVIMRQRFDESLVSILVMQTLVRRGLQRRRFVRVRTAAITVQCMARRRAAMKQLRAARHAATQMAKLVRRTQRMTAYARALASCRRIQRSVRAFLHNLRLFRRLKKLHYACATELSIQPVHERERLFKEIVAHFQQFPGDRAIRFQACQMRTVLHSLLLGRNDGVIKVLGFSCQECLDVDRLGRSSAHYVALTGSLKCLRLVSELVNTFRFKTVENMQVLDEDDEDDEGNDGNMQLKQALARSVRKGLLRQGWLKKKRGGIMWQRRWVVLTEDYIIYYKSNTSLNNPKFAIPLSGCTVVRVAGREPVVEVHAPQMGEKKSFFGTSAKKAMQFMAENEKELQEWFLPLKAVAGVQNLRAQPVHYVNTLLQSVWLNAIDVYGESLLHVLARGCRFAPSPIDADEDTRFFDKNNVVLKPTAAPVDPAEVLQMLPWCVELGSNINAQSDAQDTPLHLCTKADHRNGELFYCLLIKGADGMDIADGRKRSVWDLCKDRGDLRALFTAATQGPSDAGVARAERDFTNSAKLRGYSYLSVYFGAHAFHPDMKSAVGADCSLVVCVFNVKKQQLEDVWELYKPTRIRRDESGRAVEAFWGSTWHMQTPLENLEAGSYFVVEFRPDAASAKALAPGVAATTYISSAVFPIQTEVIDTGVQAVSLAVAPEHMRGANPIMLSAERSSLLAELVINTRDRAVDLPTIFS